jgi:hypothetical protein
MERLDGSRLIAFAWHILPIGGVMSAASRLCLPSDENSVRRVAGHATVPECGKVAKRPNLARLDEWLCRRGARKGQDTHRIRGVNLGRERFVISPMIWRPSP